MQKKSLRIAIIIGTRPEAIKLAPIILNLKKKNWAKTIVVSTGQHKELLDEVFSIFKITPDIKLNVMTNNQSLTKLTAKIMSKFELFLIKNKPDVILVQGDTTTVLSCSLVSFYNNIPVAHIEAGLRSYDNYNPFPEEVNRTFVSKLATLHFAPTINNMQNLLNEGVTKKNIYITGNSVIDSLKLILLKISKFRSPVDNAKKIILVTCHRRETYQNFVKNILRSISILAKKNPAIKFIMPVHPNPNIKKIVYESLKSIKNINLCDPLDYISFVNVMNKCHFIISDSGGVLEEATFLGKPVVIIRDKSERMEAIDLGSAKLVGTNSKIIVSTCQKLLKNRLYYAEMVKPFSPFGDGNTTKKIIKIIKKHFKIV